MSQESPSINPKKEWPLSMDFNRLRKEGIAFTQGASGDRWTDYNFHDPGVTILEQFCFAITDISYRTNLDVETILFHRGDTERVRDSHALFGPAEILTPGPITAEDYRILLLDGFPGIIKNCWVNSIGDHGEGVRGLYEVTLQLHSHLDAGQHAQVRDQVRKYFTRYRNLAEDLDTITIIDPVEVSISADIDLFQDASGVEVLSEILFKVEHYFNPVVKFQTLPELEKEGVGLEEIFDIPSHQHGFIDRRKLEPKQQQYFVSKIGDCLSGVSGVKMVRNLSVTVDGLQVQADLIDVSPRNYLTLGITGNHFSKSFFNRSILNLYKGGSISSFSPESIINHLEIRMARTQRNYPVREEIKALVVKANRTDELLSYESVQKSFPGVYGVGDFSPTLEEGPLRVAQSSQLKGYLLLFDQIMVNHLAQLAGLSEMFSIDVPAEVPLKTYFTRLVPMESTGAEELLHYTIGPRAGIVARIKELESSSEFLSAEVRFEIAALRSDLAAKETFVTKKVQGFIKELQDMSLKQLKKISFTDNQELMKAAVKLIKTIPAGSKAQFTEKHFGQLSDVQQQLIRNISDLVWEELMEKPLDCPFSQVHLDRLMRRFDRATDRKDRILSHYLARFGHQFNSDFRQQFGLLSEENEGEESELKLLQLKSAFLKEIRILGKLRAQGMDYFSEERQKDIPLRRKIALLLNLEHGAGQRITAAAQLNGIRSSPINKKDITRVTLQDGREANQVETQTGVVRFVVNSSQYHSYIFRFAIQRRNYFLLPEDGKVVVYFASSKSETPTRLMLCENKTEAENKINQIIGSLKDINKKQEGFHVVDHILLRPMEMNVSRFLIYGPSKKLWLVSKEARPREAQNQSALDTVLLGCYSTNYRILRNSKKEFVVAVKNPIGKEMAVGAESFLTDMAAQAFIENCVLYFNQHREAGTLEVLFDLDDESKFLFSLMDSRQQVLLQSIEPSGLADQEEKSKKAINSGLYPDRYFVEERTENSFAVFLTDPSGQNLARSMQEFQTQDLANDFIRTTARHLDQVRDLKSLVRYRRLNGRNAEDFNSQISIVYPNWTTRFSNKDFIQVFRGVLQEAVPAHLAVHVIGLSYAEMYTFENLYFRYLEELQKLSLENREIVSKLSVELLDQLSLKIKTLEVN